MRALVLFVVPLVALGAITCSNDGPLRPKPLSFAEQLQQTLDEGIGRYGGKGVSAAILIPGEPPWIGTSGISHGAVPITPEMAFSAGSITKMFTASTIMMLAEEGKLTLDDSLFRWLPNLPHVDSTITIRQLLNHTSGVFDIVRHPDIWHDILGDPAKQWTIEDMVRTYTLAPYFPKGTSWHYSNTGYLMLRMIVRQASGSQLASEYRSRFFAPLGFRQAYLAVEESPKGPVAHGWFDLDGDTQYDDLSQIPMTAFYSGIGGGVFATAEELARWSYAFFHDRSIVSHDSYTQMMAVHFPCPDEPMVAGYGLGVVRFEPSLFNGLEVWGHSGNAPGYAAASLYLPQYDVCIGFLDNTEEGNGMYTLMDLMAVITAHLD